MTTHAHSIEPFIEHNVLYLTEAHRVAMLSDWTKKLELKFSEGEVARSHYLYDYFGMSVSHSQNMHPAVKEWMETIPLEVRVISQNFPEAPFYCAQVIASFEGAMDMAVRCRALFYSFIYHCRNKNAPNRDVSKVFSQGDQAAIAYMGYKNAANISLYFGKVTPHVMNQVLPGFVIECAHSEENLRFLLSIEVLRNWHFQLLALFPWVTNSKLSEMLTHEFKDDVSILAVFGFSQQSSDRANVVFHNLKVLSPQKQISLCEITTLGELYKSINALVKES